MTMAASRLGIGFSLHELDTQNIIVGTQVDSDDCGGLFGNLEAAGRPGSMPVSGLVAVGCCICQAADRQKNCPR